jgi:N6-L-threonylcarbamoyladenine synthase
MNILAFETSCDDTAAAIIADEGRIVAHVVFSQTEAHQPFGGVVPEIGSRAHIEQIGVVTHEVFRRGKLAPHQIDAVAATFAPGLVGPLLVGAQFAKGFAKGLTLPLIAIHHIEGHILSGLGEPGFCKPPFVALIVSGGHCALYECSLDYSMSLLGQTLDDAAGEAFDKIGRSLGLGYPAGKLIDELAERGNKDRFKFPKLMKQSDSLNFSFSGLKTFAQGLAKTVVVDDQARADFCAGLREAVAESLTDRAILALNRTGHRSLVLGGGVAANSRLRSMLFSRCAANNIDLFLPPPNLCTDNAVMIGRAALLKFRQGKFSECSLDVSAQMPVENAEFLYTPVIRNPADGY